MVRIWLEYKRKLKNIYTITSLFLEILESITDSFIKKWYIRLYFEFLNDGSYKDLMEFLDKDQWIRNNNSPTLKQELRKI